MKIIRIIGFIFLILFGVFMFIYGGYDDSPGAQLLGLIIFIIGVVNLVKGKKKIRDFFHKKP
jgi:cadmium resistance protein CadD (predicted permease)